MFNRQVNTYLALALICATSAVAGSILTAAAADSNAQLLSFGREPSGLIRLFHLPNHESRRTLDDKLFFHQPQDQSTASHDCKTARPTLCPDTAVCDGSHDVAKWICPPQAFDSSPVNSNVNGTACVTAPPATCPQTAICDTARTPRWRCPEAK